MSRNPKPTALLKLEKGKLYDQQRERSKAEPTAQIETKPQCPVRFNKKEKQAWKDIGAILDNYGLFTAANALQLELLATAWAQYVDVSDKLSQNPNIILKGPDGGYMYNPYFNAQHKLGKLIEKYAQNLGLSSLALAKIGNFVVRGKKQKDELEDLMD